MATFVGIALGARGVWPGTIVWALLWIPSGWSNFATPTGTS